MKKRGFGAGRYNGTGGKVEEGENIVEATIREAKEEIGVLPSLIKKVAELTFTFPHNESWNQLVHVYITETWEGELVETDEMAPNWFNVEEIPYKIMWPDDIFWLPHVLNGKYVKGKFVFGEKDVILEKDLEIL